MLLIAGSPSLRRAVIDQLAASGSPAYGDALTTYGRTLQQRNGLLRAIREDGASRDELRFWDAAFLDAGAAIVTERRRLLEVLAGPLSAAHAEIAPDEAAEARLTLAYATNAPPLPGEAPRDALGPPARRDGRQGGLERVHPDRSASRRPGLRAGRPRPRQLCLAGPAANGDPGPQAGRARRPDRARRPAAAPAPRRRLLRARSGATLAPRPADRGAAPGVHHHDDARRPRPRAARDRDGLGGSAPGRQEPSLPAPAQGAVVVRAVCFR